MSPAVWFRSSVHR